jgi:hypothetical protein
MEELWKSIYGEYQKSGDLNVLLQGFATNPDLAKWAAAQQKKAGEGEAQAKMAVGIDLLKNLGFTAASLSQLGKANRAAASLKEPALPTVPGRDPLLSQALYKAQRGVVDPSNVLNPVRQEIQDGYQNALAQSQSASGGQAGAYQSLGQLANLQRMKASLGLGQVGSQVALDNSQNYNQLLSQRLMENQNQFQNQLGVSGMAFDQYNQNAAAAGALGSSARTNLMDSLGRTADTLSSNPYYLPFDDGINSYMEKVRQRNSQNTSSALSQNPRDNYIGNYGAPKPNIRLNPGQLPPRRLFTPQYPDNIA